MPYFMGDPPCDDFAAVVKEYLQSNTKLKEIRKQSKVLRERMETLKTAIINYMETKELDVCRINQNGESGQLAVRVCKSTRGIKRNNAVTEIASWLDENNVNFDNGTSSTKAEEVWARVQNSRETTEKKDVRLG